MKKSLILTVLFAFVLSFGVLGAFPEHASAAGRSAKAQTEKSAFAKTGKSPKSVGHKKSAKGGKHHKGSKKTKSAKNGKAKHSKSGKSGRKNAK